MSSTSTFANHRIGVSLKLAGETSTVDVAGVTSLKVSLDANREEWVEFASLGWSSNKVTTKSMSIALEANYKGNDDLHKKLMSIFLGSGSLEHNGHELLVTFPPSLTGATAATLTIPVSLSPSDVLGGDSSGISALSIEMMADGAPVYVPEPAAPAADAKK